MQLDDQRDVRHGPDRAASFRQVVRAFQNVKRRALMSLGKNGRDLGGEPTRVFFVGRNGLDPVNQKPVFVFRAGARPASGKNFHLMPPAGQQGCGLLDISGDAAEGSIRRILVADKSDVHKYDTASMQKSCQVSQTAGRADSGAGAARRHRYAQKPQD